MGDLQHDRVCGKKWIASLSSLAGCNFFFDAFDARSLRHFLKDQLYSDVLPQPPIAVMSPVDTPEEILKFLGRNKLTMNFWPILRGVSSGR